MITHVSFKHNGLEFSGPIFPTTIITGNSGVGKTRFLDAIVETIKPTRFNNPEQQCEVVMGENTYVRKCDEFTVSSKNGVRNLWDDSEENPSVVYLDSGRSIKGCGPIQVLSDGFRDTRNPLVTMKRRVANAYASAGFKSDVFLKGEKWMKTLNEAWKKFRDDGTHIVVDARGEPSEENGLYADLFVMRGDKRVCSIDDAGSSALSFFHTFGVLIVNGPFDVVVIDIPELQMGEPEQVMFLGILRDVSPNSQFILATGSSHIIGQVMTKNCIHLK